MTTERAATPSPAPVDAEVKAIAKAYQALKPLDYQARSRAFRWLADRLDAEDRAARGDYTEEPPF